MEDVRDDGSICVEAQYNIMLGREQPPLFMVCASSLHVCGCSMTKR